MLAIADAARGDRRAARRARAPASATWRAPSARCRTAIRGKFGVRIGFDEALAHLIEAGADMFLMPSRFEPCGLNQMYSQRYGTPPIVHATGGLADSVVNCTPDTLAEGIASGFVFGTADARRAVAAGGRALDRALAPAAAVAQAAEDRHGARFQLGRGAPRSTVACTKRWRRSAAPSARTCEPVSA